MSDDKDYYEKEERRIVKNATEKGVPFETAAIISRNIRQEGLRDYEYLQMLKGKLSDEINRKSKSTGRSSVLRLNFIQLTELIF